jgi:hypothetical protein
MFMPSLLTYLIDTFYESSSNSYIYMITQDLFGRELVPSGESRYNITIQDETILLNKTIFGIDEISKYDFINSLNNELYNINVFNDLFINGGDKLRMFTISIKVLFYMFLVYNLNIFRI